LKINYIIWGYIYKQVICFWHIFIQYIFIFIFNIYIYTYIKNKLFLLIVEERLMKIFYSTPDLFNFDSISLSVFANHLISHYRYRAPFRTDLQLERVRFALKPSPGWMRKEGSHARNDPSPPSPEEARIGARRESRCIFRTVLLTVSHICVCTRVCASCRSPVGQPRSPIAE